MDRWSPESLAALQHQGDPLADYAINEIFQAKGGIEGVNQFLGSLIRNDQIFTPDLAIRNETIFSSTFTHDIAVGGALKNYLIEGSRLATGRDDELMEKAENVFIQYGMIGFSILGCASLPEAYATSYGAKVLGITQGLTEHIERRLYETTKFVLDVMSPGAFAPGGAAIATILKVRLMHAAIRRLILDSSPAPSPGGQPGGLGDAFKRLSWNENTFGSPVHQVAMAMAILSFSYIVIRSLKMLGIDLKSEDQKAYLYRWNLIGRIMGVDEKLLLTAWNHPMAEAECLYQLIWPPAKLRTDEGMQLERALLGYMENFVPEGFLPLRCVPRILTRYLVGRATADELGVKLGFSERIGLEFLRQSSGAHSVAKRMVHTLDVDFKFANRMSAGLLTHLTWLPHLTGVSLGELPPIRLAAEWLFRLMAMELKNKARGGARPTFQIPDHLAKRWRLDV